MNLSLFLGWGSALELRLKESKIEREWERENDTLHVLCRSAFTLYVSLTLDSKGLTWASFSEFWFLFYRIMSCWFRNRTPLMWSLVRNAPYKIICHESCFRIVAVLSDYQKIYLRYFGGFFPTSDWSSGAVILHIVGKLYFVGKLELVNYIEIIIHYI